MRIFGRNVLPLRREIQDVFYLILLQGVSYVMPLLVLPYLMVTLGAEKFGYYSFSLAVCQYLMLVADFGFNLSSTKQIAVVRGDKVAVSRIFWATVWAKMVLLLVSFVLLCLLASVPQFSVYRKAMLLMFLMVVGNTLVFVFLFQGLGEVRWIAVFAALAKFMVLPLTFCLVHSEADYGLAVLLQGMVNIVAAVGTLVMIGVRKWVCWCPVSLREIRAELAESFPLFLSSAATSVYTAGFVLVLGVFAVPAEVGRYAAVDRIVRALTLLLLTPTMQVFYPKVAGLSKEHPSAARVLKGKVTALILGCMGLLGVAVVLSAPWMEQLLGTDYRGTGFLFLIAAPVPFLMGMGGMHGQLGLLALGGTAEKRCFTAVYGVAAAVAFATVCVLAWLFQAEGAMASMLLTEAVAGIGMWLGYRKSRGK